MRHSWPSAVAAVALASASAVWSATPKGATPEGALHPCTGNCTVLTLQSGTIQGDLVDGVAKFLGVPFARPPIGPLRWEPPQPPAPWSGVRSATKFSAACMQQRGLGSAAAPNVSEDCLYLNLFVPPGAANSPEPLPIMIFFHGGSYINGTAMNPFYGGVSSLRAAPNAVLVVANYRLGVLGYLASDKLRASDGSTGNFGLQDQRMVMQWAATNAAAFHGDVNRITIFGESAGAGSVSTHLVAPRSAKLFHRAIIESGPVAARWVAAPLNSSEKQFAALADRVGCASAPSVAQCLRACNASVLQANRPTCNGSDVNFSPTVDGVELTAEPWQLLQEGHAADVPVIIGTNRDEGTQFVDLAYTADANDYTAYLAQTFGPPLGAEIARQYPATRYPSTKRATGAWWAMSAVRTDAQFTCPTHMTARELSTSPGRTQPVYVYHFEHEMVLLKIADMFEDPIGCCHGSELALVFDWRELQLDGGERALAERVVGMWHDFAANGTVSGWPTWSPATNLSLVWDVAGPLGGKAIVTPRVVKQSDCDWWSSHYSEVPPTFAWGTCE